MGKIYMRAGMSPFDTFDPSYVLLKNTIGNNVGNLIYAYAMFRTLMTEETEIIPNYYRTEPKDADRINEEYQSFVIPLADAFRPDFMPELRNMTKLIDRLKIPCVVTGVGLRAPFEPGSEIKFSFDEDVRAFIKAVLNKSSLVGVRGEITSAYLSGLGFQEGKDHIVIGCPSMYTFGRDFKVKDVSLTPESRISVNASILAPNTVHEFLSRTMKVIPNHYFLPQRLQELKLLYTGQPYAIKEGYEAYPSKLADSVYEEDRVRFFLRANEWIDFLKQMDLSVGGRMHGNITAAVAGVPSILIPHDARMRELTNYHSLTHVWAKDIDEHTDIFELAARLDFQKVSREHGANFDRFISFLDTNGLDHIYKDGRNPQRTPLDIQMEGLPETSVSSIRNCTIGEMADRWQLYYPAEEIKNDKIKSEGKKLKEKVRKLEQYKKKAELAKKKREEELQNANEVIAQKEKEKAEAKQYRFFGKSYEVRKIH